MRAAQYNTVIRNHIRPGGCSMKLTPFLQETNKVEVNEVAIPTCGDDDLLIKNKCATLCHSDLVRELSSQQFTCTATEL